MAADRRARPLRGAVSAWTHVRRLYWSWWLWTLLSLWVVHDERWAWATGFAVMAIVSYITAPTHPPLSYTIRRQLRVDSPEFVRTVAGASGTPVYAGNRIEILNNGDAFYPRMLEAIESAETSITIEAYIYWAGDIGRAFATALSRRAATGLPVKILLDAVGSANVGTDILEVLRAGGCHVAWFNPIRWYTLNRVNNRTHRKSLIVDGRLAFTGGAGIADHWQGNAREPGEWRDMQIRLEGPAVVPLQSGFASNWHRTTGELISGDAFYPTPTSRGSLEALTLMSSPGAGVSSVRTMYYLSIASAGESIDIANPYFVPDASVIAMLVDAARSGVVVRIMVSGDHHDNWLARHNSIRLFGELLAAGVEIYEYNRTMLHHKTMVVDARWATIGTANFDDRSFIFNDESNVCLLDRGVAQQLHDVFVSDLAACQRLTHASWSRRGWWARAQEVLAASLRDQV